MIWRMESSLLLSCLLIFFLFSSAASGLPPRRAFFLRNTYSTAEKGPSFYVRQVPGDGGCLFHSLASCLVYSSYKEHMQFGEYLRNVSHALRELAVQELQSDKPFFIEENDEAVPSSTILNFVSAHYNQTAQEYCKAMLQPGTWGGGPEIVALSNHLRCPIHVYSLTSTRSLWKRTFQLQLIAKFGSPQFDAKAPLCILNADGRFPDLRPGKQRTPDHFLALFCCDGDPRPAVNLCDCPHLRKARTDLLFPDGNE